MIFKVQGCGLFRPWPYFNTVAKLCSDKATVICGSIHHYVRFVPESHAQPAICSRFSMRLLPGTICRSTAQFVTRKSLEKGYYPTKIPRAFYRKSLFTAAMTNIPKHPNTYDHKPTLNKQRIYSISPICPVNFTI